MVVATVVVVVVVLAVVFDVVDTWAINAAATTSEATLGLGLLIKADPITREDVMTRAGVINKSSKTRGDDKGWRVHT